MKLGEKMQITGFMVSGYRGPKDIKEVQAGIVKVIDMTLAGEAQTWEYPLPDGQGGVGATIVQPFTESFCAAFSPGAVFGDSYYFDSTDGHVFFIVASCRHYDVGLLKQYLGGFGSVLDYDIMYLQKKS